jgi:hypothetical protein
MTFPKTKKNFPSLISASGTEISLKFLTTSTNNADISPMSLDLQLMPDNSLCGTIHPGNYPETAEFFPILRIDNWETKRLVSYSTTETAFIYLIAIIYLISFLCSAFNIYWLFAKSKEGKKGFFPRRILFLFLCGENFGMLGKCWE